MRQKYVKKLIITFTVISLLFGNFSICGLGIGKAIAEDVQIPNFKISLENSKYAQFDENGKKGIAIQTKLNFQIEGENSEIYFPVKTTQINLGLPKINNCLPERANVVLTNGISKDTNMDQSYNSENGLLTICYNNLKNEEVNVKDEFEIIYIYPQEAYSESTQEIIVNYEVETSFLLETPESDKNVNGEKQIITETLKGESAEILALDEKIASGEIYKGYMYSNVQNNTTYDTLYKTIDSLTVLNYETITEDIKLNFEESKFKINDNEILIDSNKKIESKILGIKKEEFDAILGENGYIDLYKGEDQFALIKYEEIEPNVSKMIITYATDLYQNKEEDIQIVEDNNIIIDYPENLTQLKMQISKPIAEGIMHFETQKVIKASNNYQFDVEDINAISTLVKVNDLENNLIINLSEPKIKIDFESSNSNFSTLQKSETRLTIKLDDTNESCKLFDNPELIIKMPEGIKSFNIKDDNISILNNTQLLEEHNISNNIIQINLKGKQTQYNKAVGNLGTQIILELENIEYEKTMTTHEDKIQLNCLQGEENELVEKDVKIVSKDGVLMISKLEGYDDSGIVNYIDSNEQTREKMIQLNNKSNEKTITKTIYIMNNNEESIKDVQIIGRINYNFEAQLASPIETNGKVYYSSNPDADYEDDSWIENYMYTAKAYKIVVDNNEIASKDKSEIKVKFNIPENLGYEKQANLKTELSYIYNEKKSVDDSNFILYTENEEKQKEEKPLIHVHLSRRDEDVIGIHLDKGQCAQMYINVKNNTDDILENIKVNYEIPENMEYVEGGFSTFDQFEGYKLDKDKLGNINNNIFEYTIEKLEAKETANILVCLRVKELGDDLSEENIATRANIYVNDIEYQTNIATIPIRQSKLYITMEVDTKGKEILENDDEFEYIIDVKNTGAAVSSFSVLDYIPDDLEVEEVTYYINGEQKYSLQTNKHDLKIVESIGQNDILEIRIKVKVEKIFSYENQIVEITNHATLVKLSEEKETNEVKVNVKPIIIQKQDKKEEQEEKEKQEEPEKEQESYKISGIAWIDENKNGQRDENEKLQDSVVVSLFKSNGIEKQGEFVKDEAGNKITTTTNAEGKYQFDNIEEGEYFVILEFDTNTFTVTTYHKVGVNNQLNSDAMLTSITLNNERKQVAITDKIKIDADIENIDLGLIENANFDLSLDKKITKITVVNPKGTENYEYKDTDTAKVDLVAKYMNSTNVIVTYKFTIKNEGDVVGYVNSLVDSLPSGLEFSSELNLNWYKGTDGKLYTTAMSGVGIKPGESIQVELILTKVMTTENAGTFVNNASLEKISNLENIQEKEIAKENNNSSAILVISIKTGTIILYTGITLLCLTIITGGAYIINKKILKEEV